MPNPFPMRYIFFGTPRFAAIVLEKLLDAGIPPVAVVCNPDRPVGRKQILTAPAVKNVVRNEKLESRVEVLQPENPSTLISHLSSLSPDLFIIAAYAKIVSREILSIPRLGTIGVHPSLLPKYRGATPIQSAILTGEKETGVTLFLVDEKVDHGPVIATSHWPLATSETYETLEQKLAELGGELLVKTLLEFVAGNIKPIEQDHAQATFTKKFAAQDGFVEPADLARAQTEGGEIALEIDRKVRALNPEPGVWSFEKGTGHQALGTREGRRIKLLEAKIVDGKLKLLKIQREGGKPVNLPN